MKRKAKDVARMNKRRKVGELRKKSVEKGLFKDSGSLFETGADSYLGGGKFVPKVPNRTWGEFGAETLGSTAGALIGGALGFARGGPGLTGVLGAGAGALEGFVKGSNAVRAIEWGNRAVNAKGLFDQEKTNVIPIMSTAYGGKLRRSKGKSTIKVRNMYQAHGAVSIIESFGRVTDPDVVGVGHITWNQESIQRTIAYAILRKLFMQSGIICQTPVEEIRMIDLSNSGGFTLIWNIQDADGSVSNRTYAIPGDATLETIYSGSGLGGDINNMIILQNPGLIERIMLMTDANRVMGQLIMRQQRIHITCNAHTVIQNRTKSSAGSSEVTQVDAQPLKGPVFEFSGMPKTKEISPLALNISYSTGAILFRKGQLVGSDAAAWSEPPIRSSFYNVKKSSYCRLAPGVLKDFEASKTWSGPFHSVIKRWRVTAEGLSLSYAPGISQVVFLEEELNSGSANLITVGYETQFTVGCKLTTMKAPNMQPYYAAGEQNNFGA